MAELRELIERVARSDATILIQGESGTGKELVARALHELSDRREGPFVSVNCGAIPSDLLESELFGHEPGAFTGAKHRHIGRVERADGGTLLLDEVAELPAAHQVKLLRVLQERVLDRVGGTAEIPVNIRVVAATHRDLRAEVESGRFRDDLYYRLAVIPIPVPPLRDRPGDALMLARLFARKHSKRDLVFDPSLSEAIERHTWPGNVRELENAVQRLVLVRGSDTLVADDLRLTAPISPRSVLAPGRLELPPDGFSLPELEREIIEKALDRHDGNRTHAARYLGIPRHVLLYRLSKYAK